MCAEWVGWYIVGGNQMLIEGDLLIALLKNEVWGEGAVVYVGAKVLG